MGVGRSIPARNTRFAGYDPIDLPGGRCSRRKVVQYQGRHEWERGSTSKVQRTGDAPVVVHSNCGIYPSAVVTPYNRLIDQSRAGGRGEPREGPRT